MPSNLYANNFEHLLWLLINKYVSGAFMPGRNIRDITVRYLELTKIGHIPASHPFVSVLQLDPNIYRKISRLIEKRPELQALATLGLPPDDVILYVGCTSRCVQSAFDQLVNNL